tara:strand:- start:24524 stop:25531 length:1008 start_codon:yes stop_codon:yes gene_type:complete
MVTRFLKPMCLSVPLVMLAACAVSAEPLFGPPLVCPQGSICPIQQFVDVDPGPGARDPWCGTMTYDGHKGTDFRVRSMQDVTRGVEVVAMADGVVKATRDGMADQLVSTEEDRKSISSRECGNGLVLDHGGGFETQYCHMRRDSLRAKTGAKVRKGDVLGFVGASGLAAFPHVHVTLRRDGREIDPFTGLGAGEACSAYDTVAASSGWLDGNALATLGRPGQPTVLSAGFAAGAVSDKQLVKAGLPTPPDQRSQAMVGYIWAINLAQGDRLALRIEKDGQLFAEQVTEPLDRSKAVYVAYAGKKGAPAPGHYRLQTSILRQGNRIAIQSSDLEIR